MRGDCSQRPRCGRTDGDADRVVDRAGHPALLNAYAGADKTRLTVPGAGRGYATVLEALPRIAAWVETRGR